jgi:predicted transposase/invertase (TIGR01784 family)
MTTYLDPKYDLTFKRVFGEHKNLCISLINSMLMFDGDRKIKNIEYQTGELIPEIPALKNSIVDVRCTDKLGRQFIVEMQMNWTEIFKSRVLLNASKAYVIQLDKAKDIELLQPVYALNFVNENFEKSPEMEHEYYHQYKIVNINHTEKQIKGLEFVFIELPKFHSQNRAEDKLHELWLRFLTEINENTKQVPEELMENEDTREALEYMKVAAFSKEQLHAYDQNKIDVLTAKGMFSSAKKEARAEGLAEGLAEGEVKGRTEEKNETAIKMLEDGMPIENVCKYTGLSIEQIKELIK